MPTATIHVLTHASLCQKAQQCPPEYLMSCGGPSPLTAELRTALGIADGQTLALHVLVDRSGSVFSNDRLNRDQAELVQRLEAAEHQNTTVAITGFDGSNVVSLYELKLAGVEAPPAIGRQLTVTLGGGGTPTAEAVAHAAAELAERDADHKLLLVITDGAANRPDDARAEMDAARQAGVRVITGVVASDKRFAHDVAEGLGEDAFVSATYGQFIGRLRAHLTPETAPAPAPETFQREAVEEAPALTWHLARQPAASSPLASPGPASVDAGRQAALLARLDDTLTELAQATGEDAGQVRAALQLASATAPSETLRTLASYLEHRR